MSATIIDGKAIAERLRARVAEAVSALKAPHGATPGLAVVLVGDDPASQVYVRNKVKFASEAGLRSIERRLPAGASEAEVIETVRALSDDPEVDGILAQLPHPDHINSNKVIETIDPEKDVDGLTEASAGRLALGQPGLRPCTPVGCVMLAEHAAGDLTGARVVVIGRSILVGKPAATLFLEKNATVTIAHSRTQDLPALARQADVLIAAVGRPQMVRGDWVKSGATVIDVGINRAPAPERGPGKTKLVGDVDFDEAKDIAGAITPVPGGVGPMTIACLLRNAVLAACARRGWEPPVGF